MCNSFFSSRMPSKTLQFLLQDKKIKINQEPYNFLPGGAPKSNKQTRVKRECIFRTELCIFAYSASLIVTGTVSKINVNIFIGEKNLS